MGELAIRRPWRYAAVWGLVLGASNLLARILLGSMPAARAAPLAALTGLGLFLAAGLITRWRVRVLLRQHGTTTPTGRNHP